ncbi:phage tail protein [Lactiplantibacillus plantarum]|uniref:phage tail protein n=1 Tax=Lactiplantibacillus plantarum TaxID=1590 RepID=UPI003F496113
MIKFHDPAGTPHFGQATITRTTSVNGGLSLTGEVFAGGDVLNGLDYGWWLNFDNEKYVITYKKLSDDTNTVVFDAVQQFFWDFAKVALHAQYTGSHEYTFYLGQLFNESGYTYKNDVTVPAFEKENWGYKNKLDLFNDIIDQAGVEFEVHNETVHIAKQIGSDLTSFARKGINLSDLTEEMKISDFATYARGYGAFKDAEDQSKGRLEVEYRSELAKQFGDLEMDPIVDERYTIADNLIAALKKQVDATYTVSMTMNIYDLENAGYPNYEAPKVGDWILAIDEALNFKHKIRIIQLEEQFDVTGKRIGYTATCGDLSIVDQYTHLQSSLDSKVQRIQESVDNALSSANGKSTNYYGEKEPTSANEGDLWFDQSDSDPDKWSIKQWVNGRWEQITLNPGEVDAKVDVAKKEAETAVENAKSASDKADQLAAKYDDTNALANQALGQAVGAQSDASIAVATANSTASGFGKVDQKADSALTAALNAQTNASTAVTQASSAAADSKDAKQIAGAVSQSYKTLTDGSTVTIAELESGLATKLTRTDLDGYATETWTQNQIKVTADGINATLSSVKSTVDGQTTSINDLKADSSSFKSQFTTISNTLGKQTTDISTLQTTSKELTTGFNTLTTDNTTNKNDISQLKQTATEVSSTLETVQTQVRDSAVGTNLLTGTSGALQTLSSSNWGSGNLSNNKISLISGQTYTTRMWIQGYDIPTYLVMRAVSASGSQVAYAVGNIIGANSSGYSTVTWTPDSNWNNEVRAALSFTSPQSDTHSGQYSELKLEKGNVATDWCPNPADNATVTAVSKISQTIESIQTTVRGKVDNDTYQSKMTEINNAIIARVSKGDITNENILPYSGYWSDTTGWTLFPWGASDKTLSLVHHDFYHNAVDATLCVGTTQNATAPIGSSKFTLIPNTTYTFSFWGFASANVVRTNVYLLGRSYTSTNDYDFVHNLFENLKMSPSGINKYTATFKTGPTETQAYIRLDNGGSNNGQSAGSYFAELKLEQGDTATPYTRVSSGEVQITSDNINLKVSKDGVINAINISREGTLIYGNKLHITADTYIDNAVIKDAMIANLSANKLTAGSINAANINVYNINGANIVSNSITADKIQAGSMLLAMNSTLQTLKIGTDGLYTTNTSGAFIGKIHANNLIEHPNDWGLHFDLAAGAQYMAWGAQNSNDPNGGYVVKFGWTRNSSAGDFTLPWGGFWFNDNVMLHKNLSFDGGGIDVKDAYQLMKFAWIEMNGTKYPFFGSSNLKAGWLFGSSETYLVRNGGIINASKILGILNGQHYKFIKDLNSNGTVKGYVDVNF